jgi:hypothetical protein
LKPSNSPPKYPTRKAKNTSEIIVTLKLALCIISELSVFPEFPAIFSVILVYSLISRFCLIAWMKAGSGASVTACGSGKQKLLP